MVVLFMPKVIGKDVSLLHSIDDEYLCTREGEEKEGEEAEENEDMDA